MKNLYKIIITVLMLLIVSFGMIYALNGLKSSKLPWQGTASGYYDSANNVGSSYLPDNRFSFVSGSLGSGVVLDNITGLSWQSQTGSSFVWTGALNYCNTLTGGYSAGTWRLPTVKELNSITDFSRSSPSINITYFYAQSTYYWSSTTYAPTPTTIAWLVYFNNGFAGSNNKTSPYYVRCVR